MKQWNAPEIQVLNVSNTLGGWQGSVSETQGKGNDYYDINHHNIGKNPNYDPATGEMRS